MKIHSVNNKNDSKPQKRRRGAVSLTDGQSVSSSVGDRLNSTSAAGDIPGEVATYHNATSLAEAMCTTYRAKFASNREMKIVIKKTVELISDMSKSCELVFHAVRACAKFLTYPTPSVPTDNFVFGHVKGWVWLIHKGLSHFNHDKTDRKGLNLCLKIFRKQMSLLAKEANGCVAELKGYVKDLKKLNSVVRKEANLLKKHKKIWTSQMDQYFRHADEVRAKRQILIDIHEDRFFPTDWIFEPHPSETHLEWDFFHFQWINLNRDWVNFEFELRSDYSLHWTTYSTFSSEHQTGIIIHLIEHLKALLEECHRFHKINMRLSFDSQEIKFVKFAVDEIVKIKNPEAVEFITDVTRKLFEDLAALEKVCDEYLSHFEWVVTIIEPCYRTMGRWLADDLILPLEFSARLRHRRRWFFQCGCIRRKKTFLELFGEPLKVILLRSPISPSQLQKYFPPETSLIEELQPPASINAYGTSEGYVSSIFDAGLGREQPLPIHHPLPKYKKNTPERKFNIFDINRLIESAEDCIISDTGLSPALKDIDIEKYLAVMEEIQRFLAVFSSTFSFMTGDLKEKVEVLESLLYSNLPEHYESLEKMLIYESSKQSEAFPGPGARAFDRLLKIFQFVVCFLEKLNSLDDGDITYHAAKTAYYKSYGKVQGWVYQKAATFSMYSLPSKVGMFSSLFVESNKKIVALSIQNFVLCGNMVIDICEIMFRNNNIAALL